jgi:hypothetical protein
MKVFMPAIDLLLTHLNIKEDEAVNKALPPHNNVEAEEILSAYREAKDSNIHTYHAQLEKKSS